MGGRLKSVLSAMLMFCLVLTGNQAWAQINDINAAINKAGQQRMLSQRVAKSYFQIGQKIDVDRSKKVLDSSVAAFDRQLGELKAYAPSPEIKDAYQALEKSWLAYKGLLVGPISPENGRKVLLMSDEVLGLAQQGTVLLEKKSGTSAGHLVNLSGRQRMLSQRMAKYYQAAAWGIATERDTGNLDRARKDFVDAQAELSAARVNTQQITEGLALVNQQWMFFDNALGQKSGVDMRPQQVVATTSERMLEEMELVVDLYEKLPR